MIGMLVPRARRSVIVVARIVLVQARPIMRIDRHDNLLGCMADAVKGVMQSFAVRPARNRDGEQNNDQSLFQKPMHTPTKA